MDSKKSSINSVELQAAFPADIDPVRVEQIKNSAGRKIIDNIKGVSGGDTKKRKNILYTGVGDKGTTSLYNGKKVKKSDPIIKALGAVELLQKHIGLIHEWISSVRVFSKPRSNSWPLSYYTAFIVVFGCVVIGSILVNGLMRIQEPLSNGTMIGFAVLFMVIIQFSLLSVGAAYKDFRRLIRSDGLNVDHELVSELKKFLVVISYDLYKMMSDIGIPAEEVNTNFLSCNSGVINVTNGSSGIISQTETSDRYTKVHFDKSQHIEKFEEFIKKMDQHIPKINHFVLPIGGIVAANCGVANSICRQAEECVCEALIDYGNRPNECVTPIVSYLNRLSSFLYTLEQFMRVSEGKSLVFTTQLDKSM